MEKARHPKAIWWLAGVSFAESSFFPIPPDVMLMPMVLARPRSAPGASRPCAPSPRCWAGCSATAIGYFLFETVGQWIINALRHAGRLGAVPGSGYSEWGLWVILIKGADADPLQDRHHRQRHRAFRACRSSSSPRSSRAASGSILVAALLYWFGEPIRAFIERRLTLVTTVFVVALVGGFVAIKYVI